MLRRLRVRRSSASDGAGSPGPAGPPNASNWKQTDDSAANELRLDIHEPLLARMTPTQHRLLWVLWALLGLAGIAYSLLPGDVASKIREGGVADHALAFTAWSIVGGIVARRHQLLPTILAMLAVGIFIELAQRAIPGRASEWIDLFEDCSGILLGAGAVSLWRYRLSRPTTAPPD
ncbi:VanZ family protein [uncultured Paludibaculum sp.]|uniref:VanZ family protein n=1 Tax=uncultured Paludibaculum sp. TaxID=1765020 RepID=UPI002AAB03EF|nr:VanZ family protein [uncultured Paludibaculum sp.]